jgi:hypothetical protein
VKISGRDRDLSIHIPELKKPKVPATMKGNITGDFFLNATSIKIIVNGNPIKAPPAYKRI